MATEFEDKLNEITGGVAAAAAELQPEQSQAAPAQSSDFEAKLSEMQETPSAPDQSQEHGLEH